MISYLTNGFLKHASMDELKSALEDIWNRKESVKEEKERLEKKGERTISQFYRMEELNLLTEADCLAGAIMRGSK